MIKVITPSSFNFDQQVTSLVPVHAKGIDTGWLKKTAAVLTKELSEIRPESGKTHVHLIALGDQETYGLNRNGDGFPKKANQNYHDTFVKYAKWFHNHKNKPARGDKIYGNVKASAYNPDMKRVELIVAIDNEKDPDSIEKLARGEDLPVSMACRVPYDVCTVCDNRAKTADEYCKHIKEACTQMTEDGKQIGMINTEPSFFDISKVHRNADRIAFSLRKVANHGPIVLSADLAKTYGITEPTALVKDSKYHHQLGTLQKLARLEKEIEGEIMANPAMMHVARGLNEPVTETLTDISEDRLPAVLGKLASDRVVLSMPDFYRVVLGPRFSEVEADMPAAQACLPSVFSGAMKNAEDFMCGVGNYEPVNAPLPALMNIKLNKIGQQASLGGPIGAKAASFALRKVSSFGDNKSQLQQTSEIGRILATEYARYKLAALDRVEDLVTVKLAVLQDFGY